MLSIDARRVPGEERWAVFTHTGANARPTGLDAIEWARRGVELGAGELVINSMDADGTGSGYDLALLRAISAQVGVPVIASGGVGGPEHMLAGLRDGQADAVLAASIFHFGQYTVGQVKEYAWPGRACRCAPQHRNGAAMQVMVRYFAGHRDITGQRETIELPDGATVGTLWDELTARYPRLEPYAAPAALCCQQRI